MYRTILLILYLMILIMSITHLVRYRDIPSSRRLSAGFGVTGVLLAPTVAAFITELLVSTLSTVLFLFIFLGGISMIFKSVFR